MGNRKSVGGVGSQVGKKPFRETRSSTLSGVKKKRARSLPSSNSRRRTTNSRRSVQQKTWDPDTEGTNLYEVEQVKSVRLLNNRIQYRVSWQGWPNFFDEWVDQKKTACEDLVIRFWAKALKSRHGMSERNKEIYEVLGKTNPQLKQKIENPKEAPNYEYEEAEVSGIIDVRHGSNGNEYLVKWKGYQNCEEWIPEAHTKNCVDLIKDFWTKTMMDEKKREKYKSIKANLSCEKMRNLKVTLVKQEIIDELPSSSVRSANSRNSINSRASTTSRASSRNAAYTTSSNSTPSSVTESSRSRKKRGNNNNSLALLDPSFLIKVEVNPYDDDMNETSSSIISAYSART